jgi:hypothetical protein
LSTMRLRRKRGARRLQVLLALASFAAAGFDLVAEREWIAAAQLALALAFLAVLARAELDSWRLDGDALVRRTLSIGGVREERLRATDMRGVVVAVSGERARAWIEMRAGEQYALVEGDEADVRRLADRLSGSLQLATARGEMH